MNTGTLKIAVPPPRMITALRGGFDAVTNHISLILIPVILDLFLWFGPHFRLSQIMQAFAERATSLMAGNEGQMTQLVEASRELWQYLAERFNLASMLRTYPVGVPSLMSGRLPNDNPFGSPPIWDISSFGNALLLWVLFSLLGIAIASFYFDRVARAVGGHIPNRASSLHPWMALQVIVLAISFLAIFLMMTVPALLVLSLLAVFSPGMAQFATIVFFVFLVWVIIPLLFSPHGIFLYRQNAVFSMLTSIRLMRYILPGTGTFFLSLLVLSQGMDLLWEVPPTNSWMSLIGIGGHAFITTSLVASSFVYYRDAMRWVQENLQKREAAASEAKAKNLSS